MRKVALLICLALLTGFAASAQSIWVSPEVNFGITKGLSAGVDLDYRTLDGVIGTDRIGGTLFVDYKVIKYLKVSAGYSYMYKYTQARWTKKGNWIDGYWQDRQRAYVALTGSYKVGRFSFSLRERYQYTHADEITVNKYKYDDDGKIVTLNGKPRAYEEVIDAKNKHVLRSRLKGEYNIPKSPFTPFISAEMYNDLTDNFSYDKTRIMIGSDFKLNKKNSFNLFLGYMDKADDDEPNGWIIGLGYELKIK